MDGKAVTGIFFGSMGFGVLVLSYLGKQEAATALQHCEETIKQLSPAAYDACKAAAQQTSTALKDVIGGSLFAVGQIFSHFGRSKK